MKKYFFLIVACMLPLSYAGAAVIPVFDWAQTYTGSSIDAGTVKGVAFDRVDDVVYYGGNFTGTGDFDPGAGTDSHTSAGSRDAMLVGFDADGNFMWGKSWGGSGSDSVISIAAALDGGVYAVTNFSGTVDFDPGAGTAYATSSGSLDIAISKFDSNGVFQWVQAWGGASSDAVVSLSVAPDGSIFVPIAFLGTIDFDPTSGTSYATSVGSYDTGISKFSSDGTFVWGKAFGGSGFDFAAGQPGFDAEGSVFLAGTFQNTTDFDPGAGTSYATSSGGFDAFLVKLTSDGTFAWAKTWGAAGSDAGQGVGTDEEGNVYAGGYFSNTVDLDPSGGTDSHASIGSLDSFLSKFDSDGNFVWAKTWGGSGDDYAKQITTDGDGDLVVSGTYVGTVDFDPSAGTQSFTGAGGAEVSVSSFDTDGGFLGARTIGGAGGDFNDAMTLFDGKLGLVGLFQGANTDLDPSADVTDYDSDGSDAYVAIYDLATAGVTVSTSDTEVSEGDDSTTYTLVLTAPPVQDVDIMVTTGDQITTTPTTVTFASTTWDTPQTVTVTAVDDSDDEARHHDTITQSASSSDHYFSAVAVASIDMTITDNDSSTPGGHNSGGGGGSSGSGSSNNPTTNDDQGAQTDPSLPTPIITLPENAAEKAKLIQELKTQAISLMLQLVDLLREQIKQMH